MTAKLPPRWQALYKLQDSWIEQIDENLWEVLHWIQVRTQYGTVAIYPEYTFDRDSVVRNSPDWMPSLCHDFLYDHRIFKGGMLATRLQADNIYTVMNKASDCRFNRRRANVRHRGIRLFGVWAWYWRPRLYESVHRPKPLPIDFRPMYSDAEPDPSLGPVFAI